MSTPPVTDSDVQQLRDIYSVSRLNREVRALLEGSFPLIWVEGEISNLSRPASGHWYFSLKDEVAQVRCAMFRNRNMQIRFNPENGMQVLIRARISLYEARGEFQIIAEHMEEAGDGALRRAFELLKQRLQVEGLFAAERKKPIPTFARQVGVITSPTGAAIRDILSTLKRRFPALPVVVYPVSVQGAGSANQISRMIDLAAQRNECDVLILARGGGSLEDLWSFNEESVARAIARCPLPIISGVGHEIDFTIADFVADRRAPTPTAAAELVAPNRLDLLRQIERQHAQLRQAMLSRLQRDKEKLHWLSRHIRDPRRRVQDWSQRLDETQQRLGLALQHRLRYSQAQLAQLGTRLKGVNPAARLFNSQQQLEYLSQRGLAGMRQQLERKSRSLGILARALDTVSPLATLQRGYAIVSRTEDGKILRDSTQTRPGERIRARLSKGQLFCNVESIEHDSD